MGAFMPSLYHLSSSLHKLSLEPALANSSLQEKDSLKQWHGERRWKMSANVTLRLLREQLNLSIQEVADAAGVSFRTVLRAEQGAALNPASRRQLCIFY